MTSLYNAINSEQTYTENGAKAFSTTLSCNLDLFYQIGASRGKDITGLFLAAFHENKDLAVRTLLWARDVRQGQGERETFRSLAKSLDSIYHRDILRGIIFKIPELGRFDDLLSFVGTSVEKDALELYRSALNNKNQLAFKWAPRKDKKGAKPLRRLFGMNERDWRKYLVNNTEVVEQKMCAKEWYDIEFAHVPSLAHSRYKSAFDRQCPLRYGQYKLSLVKGETKINSGAVYPYDVIKGNWQRGRVVGKDQIIMNEQWKALPDFIGNTKDNILPVVDVSGSMYTPIGRTTTAIDIAISLGIYISERNQGRFKDTIMTFSEVPELVKLNGMLGDKLYQLSNAKWGMSTDIERVFRLILESAKRHSVPTYEMPTKILIISDMQFNNCIKNGRSELPYDHIRSMYEQYGYTLPQIVFWNVNSRAGNIPVNKFANGTTLVSGFSPSIMKSVLKGDLDPTKTMLDTIMKDRYKI